MGQRYANLLAEARAEFDAAMARPKVVTVGVGEKTWAKPVPAPVRPRVRVAPRRVRRQRPPCACGAPHFAAGKCRTCYFRDYNARRPNRPRDTTPGSAASRDRRRCLTLHELRAESSERARTREATMLRHRGYPAPTGSRPINASLRHLWRYVVPTLWAALLCVLGAAPLQQLHAQTLTVTTPDSLVVGRSVVVRPAPRDVLGRPTSVARVLAVPLAPGLEVTYASGGQRFTGRVPGLVPVLWLWDRTDGRRLAQLDTVRVVAAEPEIPPPFVPPDTAPAPPPPPPAPTFQRLNISEGGATLDAGGTATLNAWAIVTTDGRMRSATADEFRAAGLTWSSAAPSIATVSAPNAEPTQATVRGVAAGETTVRVCAGTLCSLAVPVRVRPAAAPVVPVDTVGGAPCRPLVATMLGHVQGDTATFVRALPGVPAGAFCVGSALTVVLEGDLLAADAPLDPAAPITTTTYPPGVVLPTAWPD